MKKIKVIRLGLGIQSIFFDKIINKGTLFNIKSQISLKN
jgi:hypothetical protein